MQVAWGTHVSELDLPASRCQEAKGPAAPALTDLGAAVAHSLENPFQFPPLRRAVTPDDHLVVVIDPRLPHVGAMLPPLLEHLTQARVDPSGITLLCPAAEQDQSWIETLPAAFQEVRIETHQPKDRKHLAYLATTQGGRRVYLNRTVVDADQTIVLTWRRYDSFLGIAGGPGILFPALGDEETILAAASHPSLALPEAASWKWKHEAEEVAWLLGVPFFVQLIEGPGDDLLHVVAGSHESNQEAERLLAAAWRVEVDEPVDLVIASLLGDGGKQTFEDMARALAHASRVVKPGGRIALLCDADAELGPGTQILRDQEEPRQARKQLLLDKPADLEACYLWAYAAEKAKLYILSHMSPDAMEEMYVTPLDKPEQVRKLLAEGQNCLVLPDAHKACAAVQS